MSQSLGAPGTSKSSNDKRPNHKWIFSKLEMSNTASRRAGISAENELKYRQKAAHFIQEMAEDLNKKSDRLKMTQLGICVATMHMQRFFYMHSFDSFDYRDVAAASVFLSGKSEESPQKLDLIVLVWWDKRFPNVRRFPSEQHRLDAIQYLVFLENVILQTIAFDLNVNLPHQMVLDVMKKMSNSFPSGTYQKIRQVAYFYASDVLSVTDWAIRYNHHTIAIFCIHITTVHSGHQIDNELIGDKEWYKQYDDNMSIEKLDEMSLEFLKNYRNCRDEYLSALKRHEMRDVRPTDMKRVKLDAYREKMKDKPTSSSPAPAVPRASFMPNLNNSMDLAREMKKQKDAERNFGHRNEDEAERRRRKEEEKKRYEQAKEQRLKEQREKDKLAESLSRERSREVEKRKMEHDRITRGSGFIEEKRMKLDPLAANFVASKSSGAQNYSTPSPASKSLGHSEQLKIMRNVGPQISPLSGSTSSLKPPPEPPKFQELEDGELD